MKKTILQNLTLALFIMVLASAAISLGSEGVQPISDAGLSRYAAQDPVVLDGTGSYDPDDSGPLIFSWRQISGPSLVISDVNAATPTISGFVQTSGIQECEFELVVSDGELISLPDFVKVITVPDFGADTLRLENPPFDPKKPTIIFFGGGDCTIGHTGQYISDPDVFSRANMINFPHGYTPDSGGVGRTYYKYGDMIIVYLSSVAPDYKQRIMTTGFSTGGQPAIDVGIRLNQTHRDARYAVNQVNFCDATPFCRNYSASISTFLGSSVDGEQCWVDNYVGTTMSFHPGVLNVSLSLPHVGASSVGAWYGNSLTGNDMNQFNNGIVAGLYWSVIGLGKNLQLGPAPGATYAFQWHGSATSGYMDFFDESSYPGRLPEPVTLVGPESDAFVDANGAVFSCEESENAVGYQLLFGPDPYHIADYYIISDTLSPPSEVIIASPFEQTWWTVKVYDQYGSTIYADPICVNFEKLDPPLIENITTGQRYASVRHAIDDARNGHEIVVSPGVYKGNLNFKGKNLTVSSTNPNDPAVVAATVINGVGQRPVVTFSRGQGPGCVLAGLSITGGTVGISCGDASPTIRNCTIGSNGPNAIEFWEGYAPTIIDCTIIGKVAEVVRYVPTTLVAYWKLDEVEGDIAYNSTSDNHGILSGNPAWKPDSGQVAGALEFDGIDDYITTDFVLNPMLGSFSAFAWIKGGSPGQVVISQIGIGGEDWLLADAEGKLMTTLRRGSYTTTLVSGSVITDGDWHHIGFVWDGSHRHLYVDGTDVAEDATDILYLWASNGGLNIGCGKNLEPGSFWSGLIDDVRIYKVALSAEEVAALAQ